MVPASKLASTVGLLPKQEPDGADKPEGLTAPFSFAEAKLNGIDKPFLPAPE